MYSYMKVYFAMIFPININLIAIGIWYPVQTYYTGTKILLTLSE